MSIKYIIMFFNVLLVCIVGHYAGMPGLLSYLAGNFIIVVTVYAIIRERIK